MSYAYKFWPWGGCCEGIASDGVAAWEYWRKRRVRMVSVPASPARGDQLALGLQGYSTLHVAPAREWRRWQIGRSRCGQTPNFPFANPPPLCAASWRWRVLVRGIGLRLVPSHNALCLRNISGFSALAGLEVGATQTGSNRCRGPFAPSEVMTAQNKGLLRADSTRSWMSVRIAVIFPPRVTFSGFHHACARTARCTCRLQRNRVLLLRSWH